MQFVTPRLIDDLRREITCEEYEAARLADPLNDEGEPKPTWEELRAVTLTSEASFWQGIRFIDKE